MALTPKVNKVVSPLVFDKVPNYFMTDGDPQARRRVRCSQTAPICLHAPIYFFTFTHIYLVYSESIVIVQKIDFDISYDLYVCPYTRFQAVSIFIKSSQPGRKLHASLPL